MGGGAAGAPDFFYKEAQRLGYVARSAFKLVQIQKQHKLIKAGSSVLDLGCAPGAWLQVACQSLGPPNHGGSVLGINLKVTQTSISLFHGNTADIVEMFFSRLRMVPVIALVGFELFNRGFLVVHITPAPLTALLIVGSCIEIGIPMLILFIALSQDKGITRQSHPKLKEALMITMPSNLKQGQDAHNTGIHGPCLSKVLLEHV
ncbi:hypothetical protein Ahy_B10g104652 isoform I [Arachis hypogaea]|uniref:rRNA methyltransferase 2, mitochondrial n=1 Tax=Arachis hypogaea TaxID=3818 RepID=A0A444X661_ARAHY|nr:hypothetical protein Ahy_B10g104652 isoform I [Arachis hypogaea]